MIKTAIAGLLLLVLSVCPSFSMGASSSALKVVSGSNFSAFVSSSDAALLMFYAPWCGHCHQMMPEIERAAEGLSSKGVGVAKIDGTALLNSGLLFAFNVKGFPSIFHIHSSGVRKFKGRRTSPELSNFALSTYAKVEPLGFWDSPFSVLGRAKTTLASSGLVVINVWEWARGKYSLPTAIAVCTLLGCGSIIVFFALGIYLTDLLKPRRGRLHRD